jgi:transmembrane sensor
MEIPEQIWLLIARNLSGEASEREQKELSEILRQDEQLHQHYDLLTRVWIEKQGSFQNEDGVSAKSAVSRIISKAANGQESYQSVEIPVIRSRSGSRRIWMAVASVLIVVFGGWLWFGNQSSDAQGQKQEIIEAQNGSRSRSVLPDGSTVWLNAGSKLYYENDFTGATREVRLDGEAFFDIVKKTDRPFIVHTSGIDIKVLGTAFNVKSYPEDKNVETTLYRGSVKVFRHEESEKGAIHLKPNEKLIISKEAAAAAENLSERTETLSSAKTTPAIPTIARIDSTKKENERTETAWVYNRLAFDGENFEEMAKTLERWYNITIAFTDEKVKELSFTVTWEGETVDQVFAYLKVANPLINYKITNNEIYVGLAK